jgi:ABC-type nitrate/sulfonate/bicarbonate transport system substrate-binding protein/predicted enzyme related to lactoylglutathione lyase
MEPRHFNALIPELSVVDLETSLAFYVQVLSFTVEYARPENRFAFLSLQGAQLMLEEDNGNWVTSPPEHPRGRGINFQIAVTDIRPLLERISAAGFPLFRDPAEHWYRAGDVEYGEREFLIQDPDGYLLRFSSGLGERPARAEAPFRPPFSSSPRCLLFLLLFLPFLLLLLPGLSSPASAAPLEKVALQLKWTHAFQFAGYYAALEQGFYREAGLDVEIREARPGTDPVAEVTAGRASFGVGASGILLARAAGRPVVALAAVFQHSPLVLVARKDAVVRGVTDLSGKRIMLEPQSEELLAFLRREGLPPDAVTLAEHSFDYRDLLEGRAEAISAYSTYEPYFLDREHVPFVLYTPLDAGIDFYGDVLFTSEAELAAHPDRVRAFREASLRGWRHAMADPEEAARLVSTRYTSPDMLEFHRFEWRQMVPLLRIDAVPPGEMTVARWQHIAEVYADLDMLPRSFSLEGFLYGPGVSASAP